MLRELKKFFALDSEEKRLFFEAYLTLGITRAAILTIPFKRLTRTLIHSTEIPILPTLRQDEMNRVQKVGKAIERAAGHTLWESACLVQSLTARRMLQKRGIPGAFYLGVMKDEETDEKMKAHAWSQCEGTIVTGEKGHDEFTVLSVFEWGRR